MKKNLLLGLIVSVSILAFVGCANDSNDHTTYLASMGISSAAGVFINPNSTNLSRAASSSKPEGYNIDDYGICTPTVVRDRNGKEVSNTTMYPCEIHDISDTFLVIGYITDGIPENPNFYYLCNKTTGEMFMITDLRKNNINEQFGTYNNIETIKMDEHNNIYYIQWDNGPKGGELDGMRCLYRLNVSNPSNPIGKKLNPDSHYVLNFEVDSGGNILYTYATGSDSYFNSLIDTMYFGYISANEGPLDFSETGIVYFWKAPDTGKLCFIQNINNSGCKIKSDFADGSPNSWRDYLESSVSFVGGGTYKIELEDSVYFTSGGGLSKVYGGSNGMNSIEYITIDNDGYNSIIEVCSSSNYYYIATSNAIYRGDGNVTSTEKILSSEKGYTDITSITVTSDNIITFSATKDNKKVIVQIDDTQIDEIKERANLEAVDLTALK